MSKTLGEKQIRISYDQTPQNPVDEYKLQAAKLIDKLVKDAPAGSNTDLAIINITNASMWVTRALTELKKTEKK